MYWWDGEDGDSFMRDLANMTASSIPLHTCPGNGDESRNFSDYRSRFAMPGYDGEGGVVPSDSLWHSFNMGPAHIVGVSTEALGYWSSQPPVVKENMMRWLENDLMIANKKENRETRPWIVFHQHRPTYSSWGDPANDPKPRDAFEELMYQYGVDIIFQGHVHNQERTFPVYNNTVMNGSTSNPYTNPRAPVYVVSGNPGRYFFNFEIFPVFFFFYYKSKKFFLFFFLYFSIGNAEETNIFSEYMEWTGWRSYHYGYTHLEVHNTTSLSVDFLSTQLGGKIVDSFTITKSQLTGFGKYSQQTAEIANVKPVSKPTAQQLQRKEAIKALNRKWRVRQSGNFGPVPQTQVDSLTSLYKIMNGKNWFRNDNWLEGDPCDNAWFGITCVNVTDALLPHIHSNQSGVTAIQLPSNNLEGVLPDDVAVPFSPTVQLIDLSDNLISGSLPSSLFLLPLLHTLYIHPKTNNIQYQLTGSIPSQIGSSDFLPNLRYLGLERNQLTGGFPTTLGDLPCSVGNASPTEPACLIWFVFTHPKLFNFITC